MRTAAAALLIAAAASPPAAALPRSTLVQYQDMSTAEVCPTPLGDDVRLSFSGLFANEDNLVYGTSIIVLLVPATGYITYNTVVGVGEGEEMEDAKVVRNDDGQFALAMDHQFLRTIGKNAGRTFVVRNLETREEVARFRAPSDVAATIAKAELCAEAAENTE